MPTPRALIVDDEPPARLRIRELLRRRTDVDIVGECSTGPEAVAALSQLHPDLLFLDVQMPGMDGFQVLRQASPADMPVTVFVTAYDRYALSAFEAHALDYLLKPFSDSRFEAAVSRALDHLRLHRTGELSQRVLTLLLQGEDGARIAVKSGGRVLFFRAAEIDWVEAAGVYVELHVGNKSYLHRASLSELELQLTPERFVRIHRSRLVNLDRIRGLAPRAHGDFSVLLRDGTELGLSRRYREQVGAALGHAF